jgi:gliding motility-associated lipoprotein GldH
MQIKMRRKSSLLFILVFLSFFSCDEKRFFDEYKSVGNSWHKDSIVDFTFNQLDTVKTYNLFLNIRNNQEYPFNNLYVIVEMEQPNKKIVVDTLEYKMADVDGMLLGEGITDTKESKLFYKENFRFKHQGDYTIYIQQAVRKIGKIEGVQQLEGVTDIGFRIEKAN